MIEHLSTGGYGYWDNEFRVKPLYTQEKAVTADLQIVLDILGNDFDKPVFEMAVGNGRRVPYLRAGFPRAPIYVADLIHPAAKEAQNVIIQQDLNKVYAVQADSRQLPFSPGSFGAVLEQFFIFRVPKQTRKDVFKEAYRILSPGGAFSTLVLSEDDPMREILTQKARKRFTGISKSLEEPGAFEQQIINGNTRLFPFSSTLSRIINPKSAKHTMLWKFFSTSEITHELELAGFKRFLVYEHEIHEAQDREYKSSLSYGMWNHKMLQVVAIK